LTLSEVDRAPFEAVRMLAYRNEPSIAVPVLSKSMRISDDDLVKIASCCGQEHLLAISSRNSLTEVVTDALIKRGNSEVAQKLAENAGASFSKYGYMALVADAEKDEGLAEKLGLRLDIPINILKQLLRRATEAVRRRLLLLANPEIRDRIQAAIDDIAEEFDNSVPTEADYAESQNIVLEINRNGHLNEAVINTFALHKEHANIIVALSLLTAVAADAIEPLYYSPRSDGLIVACRAAKLGWETTSTVLRSRGASSIDANGGAEENQKIFDALSVSSALRTLRFWAARSAAKKAEFPQVMAASA
jgi:uncharacterized protein (DUF2336 family)